MVVKRRRTLDTDMEPCQRCKHSYDFHLHLRDGMDCGHITCACPGYRPKLSLAMRIYFWFADKGIVR